MLYPNRLKFSQNAAAGNLKNRVARVTSVATPEDVDS